MSHLTILKKNEVYLQIESDPHVFYELSDQFTFELPGAKFMPQYRNRYWDGKIRLFNINNGQNIVILISILFLVKALLAYFLNHKIIEFSFNNQKRIILNISKKYSTSSLIQIQKKQTSNVIQNLMHNTDTVIISTLIPALRIV